MNDLFRAIFGIIPNDGHGQRMDDSLPKDNRNNFIRNRGDDDDDDDDGGEEGDHFDNMRMGPTGGIFGFGPFFNEPFEIHRHLDRFVDEMNKAFGVFGFSNGPSITWEDENSDSSSFYRESEPRQSSLRDAYLKKPDCACDNSQRSDSNISLNVRSSDFEPGPSNLSQGHNSFPKIYSKSVFIQTIRKPDGSVETIKKITDNEGNEKTIISQSNVDEPLPPRQLEEPLMKKDDTSGLSIFKKFFSF